MTAMSAAFTAAGYVPPETSTDKLRRLMAEAITVEGPGRGLAGPSIDRFLGLLVAEADVELVLQLFASVHDPVLRKLFEDVLADVKAGKEFGEGRHRARETKNMGATTTLSEGGAAAETIGALKPINPMSRATVPATLKPGISHAPPGGGIKGMLVYLNHERDSWLRRFTVNSKAVGDMTLPELEDAIKAKGRDCRFLIFIRDAWPAYTGAGKVADYISDEDGNHLYEKA